MENKPQPQVPITPLSLLTRQLADWQNLLADLIQLQGDVEKQEYCRRKITALVAELNALNNQ
ncbi:hypothetical protein [Spirosoma spitsbergense]|uniref:hypothetical protein n=1 Tax=Spirosoma spitsbergense TaxID=431554 RepID=UPI0003650550|nr:hypothetical protein [Spirosoma spitsbergense]